MFCVGKPKTASQAQMQTNLVVQSTTTAIAPPTTDMER